MPTFKRVLLLLSLLQREEGQKPSLQVQHNTNHIMSYDGTICMNRKLTEEETHELRIKLIPYFTTDGGMGVDDMADFLDYIFTMVSNSKAVDYVVKELDGFCSPETSKKIGYELATNIELFNGTSGSVGDSNEDPKTPGSNPGKRVVSLKVSNQESCCVSYDAALFPCYIIL